MAARPACLASADLAGRCRVACGREPPDALFAALADPTRRWILRAVAERGPVTATALAGGLPVTRQAVAKHLGLLREAGLVAAERAGRETRFTAGDRPARRPGGLGGAAGRRWDDRLARLRRPPRLRPAGSPVAGTARTRDVSCRARTRPRPRRVVAATA